MKTNQYLILIIFLLSTNIILSQRFDVNSTVEDPSAIVQIDATNRGLLIPRMTDFQILGIPSPANGLLVYNTSTTSYWFFNGTFWEDLSVKLLDGDSDTGIDVELTSDDDVIRFLMKGVEHYKFKKNIHGMPVIDITNSGSNVIIGFGAGNATNPTGNGGNDGLRNTFIGQLSGRDNVSGHDNTYIGHAAGLTNISGNNITAIGESAGGSGNSISQCVFIGSDAGYNDAGKDNIMIGFQAGFNSTSDSNIGIGTEVMFNNVTGTENVIIGEGALRNPTASSYNVAVGKDVLKSVTSGFSNSAIGVYAMESTTSGSHNSAFGESALRANTTGSFNTAFGDDSGLGISTGSHNVAIGNETLKNATSQSFLVAIGDSTLNKNGIGASGAQGGKNIAIGSKALKENTTGQGNTAAGYQALKKNNLGNFNTSFGNETLLNNTSGDWNTAIGNSSMSKNTIGYYNTALGHQSLFSNTEGIQNTALGYDTHYASLTGDYNTAVGAGALYSNDVGNCNTMIGHEAGYGNLQGNGNVFIGYKAGYNEFGDSLLYIDNTDTSLPLLYGDFETNKLNINGALGVNTIPGTNLDVHIKQQSASSGITLEYHMNTDNWKTNIDGVDDYNFTFNGSLKSYIDDADGMYYVFSDRRLKQNVQSYENVLDKMTHIQAKTYNYISDKTHKKSLGLIAQEIEKLFPEVVLEKDGYKTINYSSLSVVALEAIKEQQQIISSLESKLSQVIKRLEALEMNK